jgi:hypothetical protein
MLWMIVGAFVMAGLQFNEQLAAFEIYSPDEIQFLVSGAPATTQLILMGSVCVLLNTLVDVGAVFGAARLLRSGHAAQRRARILNKASGLTLVGLGLYVAAARRVAP